MTRVEPYLRGVGRGPAKCGALGSAALLVGWILSLPATAAAITYENPFHPEQCDRAIAYAERRLANHPRPREQRILAEGLLCRGLSGDDWALQDAIFALQAIVREPAGSAHAQIALAEALRKEASASMEAMHALRRSKHRVTELAPSAASDGLMHHLVENETAMRQQRVALQAFLARQEPAARAGTLAPEDLQRVVAAARLLGAEGREGARQALRAHAARAALESPLAAMVELLRAELDRGRTPVGDVLSRYAAAAAELCGRWRAELEAQICGTVEARLAELRWIAAGPSPAVGVRRSPREGSVR